LQYINITKATHEDSYDAGQAVSEELRYGQMSRWRMHMGEGSEQQQGLWGRE